MQQIIALSLAFAAAALSLVLAGGEQTIAPFGWSAVILVHALATLPLAVIAAHAACALWPVLRQRWAVVLFVPAGLLLGWLTFHYGGSFAARLRQQEVGGLLLMVVRILWLLALQLPWTLLALQRREEQHEPRELKPRRMAGLSMVAVAIAVVLPRMYLDDVVRRRIDEVNAALGQGRLVQALESLEPICDVGASHQRVRVVEGGSLVRPIEARQYWAEQIEALVAEVARLRREKPTAATQYQIALSQRALGDVEGARAELSDLAEHDAAAALLMAQTYYDERDWSEAQRRYRQAARLAETHEQPSHLRTAYDALAAVAGQQRKFHEAEAVYLRAIEQLPDAEAHFRFQLGLHYQLVGRPLEARRQWEEAAKIDPARFQGEVDKAITGELNSYTPGCLLGPLRFGLH